MYSTNFLKNILISLKPDVPYWRCKLSSKTQLSLPNPLMVEAVCPSPKHPCKSPQCGPESMAYLSPQTEPLQSVTQKAIPGNCVHSLRRRLYYLLFVHAATLAPVSLGNAAQWVCSKLWTGAQGISENMLTL